MLDAALRAPAAPDVEHVRRAEQVLGRHQPARFVQQRQGEVRRRPVDQRRGQGLAVAAAGLAYAVEQQREEGEEANGADDHGKARTAGGCGHARSSGSFAAGRCAGLARKRLSSAVTKPPSAISAAPSQIQRTKGLMRSEEHTSELQSLMRISYAVFCLKKKK